jgi:hypothetical protein
MWGVATVLMATLAVIQINNIRSDYGQADEAFAEFFGRGLFYVIAALTVVGNVALPLCALFVSGQARAVRRRKRDVPRPLLGLG